VKSKSLLLLLSTVGCAAPRFVSLETQPEDRLVAPTLERKVQPIYQPMQFAEYIIENRETDELLQASGGLLDGTILVTGPDENMELSGVFDRFVQSDVYKRVCTMADRNKDYKVTQQEAATFFREILSEKIKTRHIYIL
jgi:hypothetical protein